MEVDGEYIDTVFYDFERSKIVLGDKPILPAQTKGFRLEPNSRELGQVSEKEHEDPGPLVEHLTGTKTKQLEDLAVSLAFLS